MRVILLSVIYAVGLLQGAVAEGENEVSSRPFPYMAILYYTDEGYLEKGLRFTRSAALIRDDWLISSADVSIAFPQKTLLARLGANHIDIKLSLNEDEDEQEREIILILRPYNLNATKWWKTDISLLKTLMPFNKTLFVAPIPISNNFDIMINCYILVYAKSRDNATERELIQMNVKLLPPTLENCGNYYENDTMVCAAAAENNKNDVIDEFCQGNSGGPLICDNVLTGLQTYINDCKQPYLYQLLKSWNKFLTCAAEERYLTQSCADICDVITKDPPTSTTESPEPIETTSEIVSEILDEKTYNQPVYTETVHTPTKTAAAEVPTTMKVEDPIVSSDIETMTPEIKENKEQRKTNTPPIVEKISHDTSATDVTFTEKTAIMESKDENGRRSLNKPRRAKSSVVSQIVPSLIYYLVTAISILAYT